MPQRSGLDCGKSCGPVQSMAAGAFDIWRFRLPAGYVLSRHAHEITGFVLCIEGEYRARVAGSVHRLRPGDVMVMPRGVEHEESTPVATDCLIVAVNPERDEPPRALSRRMRGFSLHPGRVAQGNLHRLWFELVAADDVSPAEADGVTREIVGEWLDVERPRTTGPGWLDRAERRLRYRFTETQAVTRAARASGVSTEHLVRAFRSRHGVTPGRFVRYRRLATAERALIETDAPIAQVALDAGFADQSHLTRLFRMVFRTTPGRYRLEHA